MADLVSELDLPEFDITDADLSGDAYHERLAAVRELGWLVRSPIAFVVLDREAGEFFLRARQTAFPGREIAELFGITGGRLAEQIDANILNLTGDRHRRLRALVGAGLHAAIGGQVAPGDARDRRRALAESWRTGPSATSCPGSPGRSPPAPSPRSSARPSRTRRRCTSGRAWCSGSSTSGRSRPSPSGSSRPSASCTTTSPTCSDRRRGEPADDLISALLRAEADGERLSGPECVNLVLNVLAGGVDTTSAQLAHALRLFAAHPDQWEALRRQPELVTRAADEVLRFEPITPFTARLCTEQIEYRGVIFPAGTIVAICAERANRESASGEVFDITAEPAGDRVLTFGAGPHFCLGQNLARAELEEALGFLAPRLPGLRAAGPERLGGVEGIYGIESLPLAWSAA